MKVTNRYKNILNSDPLKDLDSGADLRLDVDLEGIPKRS